MSQRQGGVMKEQHKPGAGRAQWPALALLATALLGMTYCHIKDVGMKFDEHVYYMAYLFSANIVASAGLAGFVLACRLFGGTQWLRRSLLAALVLALATIAGFVWSRTAGFPQMDDHIGEWDLLGLTSVAFEATVAVVAGALVLALGRATSDASRVQRRRVVITATCVCALVVALFVAIGPASADDGMRNHWGNMLEYPDLMHASPAHVRAARVLHLRTNRYSSRFATPAKARKLGYKSDPAERERVGCPGFVHYRKGGFWGQVLNPKAPQALVFWCDSRSAFKLAAFMYRAPRTGHPPTLGGLLGWHRHSPTGTWMTHVWLTYGVRAAFATCAPFAALHRSLAIDYESYVQ